MTLLALMDYKSISSYNQAEVANFQREMEEGGWKMYQINASRTNSFVSIAYKRQMPRDTNGFTDDKELREGEVDALRAVIALTDTGVEEKFNAYKDVIAILLNRGWMTADYCITEAGRIAYASQEKNGS